MITKSGRDAIRRGPWLALPLLVLAVAGIALSLVSIANAGDGTAKCDSARRNAIKAVAEAWMREEPVIQYSTGITIPSPCSCGDCFSEAVYITPGYGASPHRSSYYECKLREAQAREAAEKAAQQARQDQEAREDAAREAMYMVREACGEGPKRPEKVKWEPLSEEESKRLTIGAKP